MAEMGLNAVSWNNKNVIVLKLVVLGIPDLLKSTGLRRIEFGKPAKLLNTQGVVAIVMR